MTREQVLELIGGYLSEVKRIIVRSLVSDVPLLSEVNETITSHSGKMLRPMLSLLTAGALGKIANDSIKLAAAVEILHNATLIHDDVADNSLQRRGMPTINSMVGPSSAVLVGDFWLARSVELAQDTVCGQSVFKSLSGTLTDLAEGEMLQLGKSMMVDTDEDDYFRIIYCKTGSLFRCACSIAAVAVGASQELISKAAEFGRLFGMAFQIKDDILDYASTPEMGKPDGVDIREKKITLPLLGAIRNRRNDEAAMRALVKNIDSQPSNFDLIHSFVMENGGVEYSQTVLEQYVGEAVKVLDHFPCSPYRDALESIASYNICRKL